MEFWFFCMAIAQSIPTGQVFVLSLILIGLVVIGFAVALQVKRRVQQGEEPGETAGFTLSDLRRLHKTGQMSDQEFEQAKGQILTATKRAAERDAAKIPPGRGIGTGGVRSAGTPASPPVPGSNESGGG